MTKRKDDKEGWPKFFEALDRGDIPKFAYCNKATAEGALKRHHFELLSAYNIQLRLSQWIPDEQIAFVKSDLGYVPDLRRMADTTLLNAYGLTDSNVAPTPRRTEKTK